MRSIIFQVLKQMATVASGLGADKKLFILIYHRVLDEPDFMRFGEVDKKEFTWQMELLHKYFNVLSLQEGMEKLKSQTLPSRAVCITFDDGYADNYLNALPILKRYNQHATFFIASGYLNGGLMWNDQVIESVRRVSTHTLDLTGIGLKSYDVSDDQEKSAAAQKIIQAIKHMKMGQRQILADKIASGIKDMPVDLMMSDEQLIRLQQAGMEIGGHTVSHPIMAKLDKETVAQELMDNKKVLESLLKITVRFFAYPNGRPDIDYLSEQVDQVKEQGYEGAVSTQWGVADKTSDVFQLPRFTPWDKHPIKFMLRMIRAYF